VSRTHDIFAGIAIDSIPGSTGEIRKSGLTVEPLREEAGHDAVTNCELSHPFANRLDYAGAICEQDNAGRCRQPPHGNAVVMIVERAGVKPDEDLAARGRAAHVVIPDSFSELTAAYRASRGATAVRDAAARICCELETREP